MRKGENVVESVLMRTHLARTPFWNLAVAQYLDLTGCESEIDRVEDEYTSAGLDVRQQAQAERATVHQLDAVGEAIPLVQGLDRADAEAFISPQQIADTEHEHFTLHIHRV